MTRKLSFITITIAAIISCRSTSPDAGTQSSVSAEPVAFGITGGNTEKTAAKHTVAILPFNGRQLLGVGSGFFAADRCVLTVAHNFNDTPNGGEKSALVLQTLAPGVNILDPAAKSPRELVLRVNTLPIAANPNDLAFVWIERRTQDDPDNPRILLYDRQTPAFDIPKVPTSHKIFGFGGGAQGTAIQKSGTANATTVGRPTQQMIPNVQLNNVESGLLLSVPDTIHAGSQSGDSGGPIFGKAGPLAVIEGELSDPNTNEPVGGSGILFAPFEPWIRVQLSKFCKPQGGAGVSKTEGSNIPSDVQLTISGGAFFSNGNPWDPGVVESQSIICSEATTSVCGSSLRADDPFMANVTITATVNPPSGYMIEWPANTCNGSTSGTPYQSSSCTWTYNPDNEGRYESITYKLLRDPSNTGYGSGSTPPGYGSGNWGN